MYLNFDSKLRKFSESSRNSEATISGPVAGSRKNDMQSVDLSGNLTGDFSGDRESFRSSSACHILDKVTDLHRQVADLNQNIADLKTTIHTKNVQIENIQRDNERLASELKKQQRCNRNLKQQLDDERFFYQKEKEHLFEEMQNHKAKCFGNTSKAQQQQCRETDKIRQSLEEENKQLRDKIEEKSETTYNLCIKFLRMKDARDSLRQKLDRLLQEHLQVMAEMMEKLDEAREELNIIVSEKFQEPLPISKEKFLQVVQRNSKLVYENATLKLHVQQLTLNIEKLKSEAQKTKTINVDARTIEKLTECGRRRRSEDATKLSAKLSCNTNPNKSLSMSKSTSPVSSPIIDQSINGKIVSAIRGQHRGKMTITQSRESPENMSMEIPTERTQSAPEIVQTSTFRQYHFSETPTNYTNISERSAEFRDTSTNT